MIIVLDDNKYNIKYLFNQFYNNIIPKCIIQLKNNASSLSIIYLLIDTKFFFGVHKSSTKENNNKKYHQCLLIYIKTKIY